MNDNLNNQNNDNEKFDFRKELENQRKEVASMQKRTESYHTATLPADGGNSYKRGFRLSIKHLIIVVLLVFVSVFGYNYYQNKKNLEEGPANLDTLYGEQNLIKFLDNGLYGYVSYEGNVEIEPSYDSASNFYNGYAIVNQNGKNYIINSIGKVVYELNGNYYGYNTDYDYWYFNKSLYSGKMLLYYSDVSMIDDNEKYFYFYNKEVNQSRIINYKGESIFEIDGNISVDIKKGSFSDELMHITANGKHYILNPESKAIIFESNNKFTLYDNGIFKNDRINFVYDDQTIYPYNALSLKLIDKDKMILKVEDNSGIYYYDHINNVKLEDYEEGNIDIIDSLYNYKVIYCDKDNNKYSLLKNNDVILGCEYDKIEFLDKKLHEYIINKNGLEYVKVTNGSESFLYNLSFKYKLNEQVNMKIDYVDGSLFIVYTPNAENNESHIVVYNLVDGLKKKYIKNDYEYYDSGYNYYVLYNRRDEKLEYYNYKMKKIYSVDYDIHMK